MPSSSWYACARCSPASFETAYVQRASPTEPIVETWPSFTLNACVPKTSLVEKSISRSSVALRRDRRLEHVVRADQVDAHRAHRALEHGVDAGDRRAVDDVRRAGRELAHRVRVEDVGLVEREVRMVGEIGRRERVAVEVVERDDLVVVDERAGERRRDEARAARDEDALPLQSHGGHSSLRACRATSAAGSTRSRAPTRSSSTARGGSSSAAQPEADGARRARSRSSGDGTLSRAGLAAGARRRATSSTASSCSTPVSRSRPPNAEAARPAGRSRPRELRAPAESDERAIEIPWCLARYDGEPRVLDVGYAFAEPAYLAGLARARRRGARRRRSRRGRRPGPPLGRRRRAHAAVRRRLVRPRPLHLDARARRPRQRGLRRRRTARRHRRRGGAPRAAPRARHATAACSSASRPAIDDDQGWQVVRTPEHWIERFERSRLPRLRGRALRARRRRLAHRVARRRRDGARIASTVPGRCS